MRKVSGGRGCFLGRSGLFRTISPPLVAAPTYHQEGESPDSVDAVALTSYDDNGIYGHIDHVQVHEIAVRSVEGTSCEHYESTLDRSALRRLRTELVGRGLVSHLWPSVLAEQLGVEDGPALATVDVTEQLET